MLGAVARVKGDRSGLDGDLAGVGDGVPGVHAQVHQDLIDLGWIDLDRAQTLARDPGQVNVLADQPPNHGQQARHRVVEIKHLGVDGLPAGKAEQLPGEISGPTGCIVDVAQAGVERLLRGKFAQGQFGVTEDDRQHVVEVMGDAAGQPPYAFHLLGLRQLSLQLLPLRLRLFALGDVAGDAGHAEDLALHDHRQPVSLIGSAGKTEADLHWLPRLHGLPVGGLALSGQGLREKIGIVPAQNRLLGQRQEALLGCIDQEIPEAGVLEGIHVRAGVEKQPQPVLRLLQRLPGPGVGGHLALQIDVGLFELLDAALQLRIIALAQRPFTQTDNALLELLPPGEIIRGILHRASRCPAALEPGGW